MVAITACPTGIAHTYMAADHLVNAGKEMGIDVQIETQGSSSVTPVPASVIRNASAVIFATDVGVKDRERFAGLPVIESGVKRAINEPARCWRRRSPPRRTPTPAGSPVTPLPPRATRGPSSAGASASSRRS